MKRIIYLLFRSTPVKTHIYMQFLIVRVCVCVRDRTNADNTNTLQRRWIVEAYTNAGKKIKVLELIEIDAIWTSSLIDPRTSRFFSMIIQFFSDIPIAIM